MSSLQNLPPSMTSREIAELVGSRHDNVRVTIERLAERGIIELPAMQEIPTATKPVAVYVFTGAKGKRDSIIVVAQLCPEFTALLVDRWQVLEASQAKPSELSRLEILSMAMESEKARIEAEEKLALAAPKVEFVDRYVDSTGLKGFRQVAKLLGANESRFREFLSEKGVMYRLGGEWMPYQQHIDAGRFEVRTGTSEQSNHSFNQAKFTPKGVAWITGLWSIEQMRIKCEAENDG